MRIAVDIDSTLADIIPHIIPELNQKYGLKLQNSDICEWDFPVGGVSIGKHIISRLADPAFVLSMPEVLGAKKAMKELYKNHELIITTGRPLYSKNNTIKWLDPRFLYNGLVFSREKTVKTTNCDLLIDDCYGYMQGFLNSGGRGIVLDRPWNQANCSGNQGILDENRCFRAENWPEVLKIVKNLEN